MPVLGWRQLTSKCQCDLQATCTDCQVCLAPVAWWEGLPLFWKQHFVFGVKSLALFCFAWCWELKAASGWCGGNLLCAFLWQPSPTPGSF